MTAPENPQPTTTLDSDERARVSRVLRSLPYSASVSRPANPLTLVDLLLWLDDYRVEVARAAEAADRRELELARIHRNLAGLREVFGMNP